MSVMRDFLRDDGGATSIEYALIAGLIAIALIASATLFATRFSVVAGILSAALS